MPAVSWPAVPEPAAHRCPAGWRSGARGLATQVLFVVASGSKPPPMCGGGHRRPLRFPRLTRAAATTGDALKPTPFTRLSLLIARRQAYSARHVPPWTLRPFPCPPHRLCTRTSLCRLWGRRILSLWWRISSTCCRKASNVHQLSDGSGLSAGQRPRDPLQLRDLHAT